MYDFETARRRAGIGAEKWDMMTGLTGYVPENMVPFSIADMEFLTAPEIMDALRQAVEFGEYGYTIADEGYRAAVCGWFARRHGWAVRPEWMVQTYGVVSAMLFALYAFTKPGDKVIYQPPVYGPFRRSIEQTGRVAAPNPLVVKDGRYEMDFDGLEALVSQGDAAMLMLCSPHNPTGRVWTRAELERVSDLCLRHGVLVFSDEIHCDFVYAPHVHIPYATLSAQAAEHCVVGTSASKTFNLAGLANSNILIPNAELRERFAQSVAAHAGEYTNYFGPTATRAAYEKGAPWLEELKTVLWGNYEYCKEFLQKKFPSVKVYPLEGTYLLWADFRSLGLEPKALEEFMLHQAGLCLDEGYIFGAGGEGFERINLACPRRYLETAMEQLDRAAAKAGLKRTGE